MSGLNDRQIAGAAGAVSGLLLIAALGFQSMGYAPCELCILQRWPHLAAAIIGAAVWFLGWRRWLALLGALAAAVATGFAIYHAGVELKFWAGPQHCSGGIGALTQMSTRDLMVQLQSAPVVRCDEIAWSFLGVSMAGWNALISACLVVAWMISGAGRRPVGNTGRNIT